MDAGGARVVSVVRQSAVGKGSGATVELVVGIVYTLKAGQIVDQCIYLTPTDAFDAVARNCARRPSGELCRGDAGCGQTLRSAESVAITSMPEEGLEPPTRGL